MPFERVIQQNYGFVWEDVATYPCNRDGHIWDKRLKSKFLKDLKEYRQTGWATKQFYRKCRILEPVTAINNH